MTYKTILDFGWFTGRIFSILSYTSIITQTIFAILRFRLRTLLLKWLGAGNMTLIRNGYGRYGEVGYWDGPHYYKMRFPLMVGPSIIEHVTDVKGNDITSNFRMFMGAGKNFGGVKCTPGMFDWKEGIIVYCSTGGIFQQSGDDTIVTTLDD